jgi:hypothetical protein
MFLSDTVYTVHTEQMAYAFTPITSDIEPDVRAPQSTS